MARIRKHRDKWQVLYRDPATKKEMSAGVFAKKIDANMIKLSIDSDIALSRWIEPERTASSISLSDWWQQIEPTWLRRADSTRSRDASYFKSLVNPYLGSRVLSSIDSLALEQWIAHLDEAGYSPATIAKAMQLVGRALQEALDKDRIVKNPTNGMKGKLPAIEQTDSWVITPAEVRHLADATDGRYRAFTLFAYYAGTRWGETAAIRRSRLDLRRGTATIDATLARDLSLRPPKTSRSKRTIHLPDPLIEALRHHLENHYRIGSDPNLIFTAPSGGPMRYTNWRRRVWVPATRLVELDGFRFHELRHSHATFLIDAGIDPVRVSRRLGHSRTSITMDRYSHLLDRDEEAILRVLSGSKADLTRTDHPDAANGAA
jgi:integrase